MSGSVIVIGGGHNGLTAATMLARSGRRVVLCEASAQVGGLAAGYSFAEGFSTTGVLHDSAAVRQSVVSALKLESHGLKMRKSPVQITAPSESGESIRFSGDRVEGPLEPGDVEAFQRFMGFISRLENVFSRIMNENPPDPFGSLWPLAKTAVGVRMLGAKDMTELLRIGPMCVADWMRDELRTERLRAAIAQPALLGSWMGPWSPGSAANLLIHECVAGTEIDGGPAALVVALEAAAKASGVEIRTGARVERIRLSSGKVVGVTLSDGEEIDAPVIASACDPKQTFGKLIGQSALPIRLHNDIRCIRSRGTTAKLHLALSGPLEDSAGVSIEAMRTGESLDDLERAFDAVKYGQMSEAPILDVRVPSMSTPGLAPDGSHVVSVLAHFAPYDIEGGWTEESRKVLTDRVIAQLKRFCPRAEERIVATETLTPVDLEKRYGLTQGHIFHGEHAPDQLLFMRPTVQCGRYTTPIGGLFLCGSGSHPGGGITCAPGALGARAIFKS